MSGLGNRFIKEGYKEPKPMIKVDNKPMIEHVVNLFPEETDFLFICNKKHLGETNMHEVLQNIAPEGVIFSIDQHEPKGPVYDILLAAEYVKDTEPVIVNYCDFNQHWYYPDFKAKLKDKNPDGAVVCYTGFHPHLLGINVYAGCRVNSEMNLLEIKEKHSFTLDKMSGYHSSGTYYFKSGAMMKKYFNKLLNENININGEHYASLAYIPMLEDKMNIVVYITDYFCQWGTPEDLNEYNYWSEYFLKPNK